MQIVRVYDPDRDPPRQVILPGQYVAYSTLVDSGALCDAEGTPIGVPDEVTCLIFESLPEATSFCRMRVEQVPTVRFDLFDSVGRTLPPLLTVVHPSRAERLEGNRRSTRISHGGALALIATAPILFWFDWAKHEGLLILPTILGINMLMMAGRLLQLNSAYTSAEKSRRARVAQHVDRGEP